MVAVQDIDAVMNVTRKFQVHTALAEVYELLRDHIPALKKKMDVEYMSIVDETAWHLDPNTVYKHVELGVITVDGKDVTVLVREDGEIVRKVPPSAPGWEYTVALNVSRMWATEVTMMKQTITALFRR